ncbi:MAG: AraC-like DNA-binding protein [Oleispira sp.]|mgnify:FL=1|jgi:AraC-like DNA-binding protein
MPILPQVALPFVRLLYQFWLDHNVPKNVLDDIVGADIEVEGKGKFGISSHKMARLHQAAVESTDDHSLGIRLGQYIAKSNIAISDMLLRSQSLESGLEVLLSHSSAITESGFFELTDIGDEVIRLSFHRNEGVILSNYQKDVVFTSIYNWFSSIFFDANKHIKYFFDARMVSGDEHKELLDCIICKSDDTYLEVSKSLLIRENPYANKVLFDKNIIEVGRVIAKRKQRLDLYIEVRTAIESCLLQRNATQENVAQQLNLTIRNMQRRLKEVGVTYQSILDDSREALALSLIKEKSIPLYEISFLVGFTEPSAFYKAFRRWTGKRPGDYRQTVSDLEKTDNPEHQFSNKELGEVSRNLESA